MNDDRDLRDAFAELRNAESRSAAPFRVPVLTRTPRRGGLLRWSVVAIVLMVAFGVLLRDETQVRSDDTPISEWRAPTDFLLLTPGVELVQTLPRLEPQIPAMKGDRS